MQKYGITEIARLFGITPEAIRKYEVKGVVKPKRNLQNSFREYDSWDIATILHARKYKQMGFSVSQTAELLHNEDINRVIYDIEVRHSELMQEIKYNNMLIEKLHSWKNELVNYLDSDSTIHIEKRPRIMYCQLFDTFALSSDQYIINLAKDWMNHLPFVNIGFFMKKEDVLNGCDQHTGGVCASMEDIIELGIKELPYQIILEEIPCISIQIPGTYGNPMVIKDFDQAFEFMEANGYVLADDIFAKVVMSQNIEGEYHFHHKVWIPVNIAEE